MDLVTSSRFFVRPCIKDPNIGSEITTAFTLTLRSSATCVGGGGRGRTTRKLLRTGKETSVSRTPVRTPRSSSQVSCAITTRDRITSASTFVSRSRPKGSWSNLLSYNHMLDTLDLLSLNFLFNRRCKLIQYSTIMTVKRVSKNRNWSRLNSDISLTPSLSQQTMKSFFQNEDYKKQKKI